MASAPFHSSSLGPPSSGHSQGTLEWGAAVHGSSACLQAIHQGYLPTFGAGAALPQLYQVDAQQYATQAMYSFPYQGSTYGYSEHQSYSHAQPCVPQVASGYHPQHSAWQHQAVSNSSQYPAYTTHAQYYQHAQQYSWQSFNCHSAVQDPAAAADRGDNWDSWKGWASYSGARQTQPPDGTAMPLVPSSTKCQHLSSGQQQQLDTQGSGQADSAHNARQEERQIFGGAGNTEAAAAAASTATGPGTAAPTIANELYNPLAHAEADTLGAPNAAADASASTSSPDGTERNSNITTREATAAGPQTAAEANGKKGNDDTDGVGRGGSMCGTVISVAAAALPGSAVTAPPAAQATDLIVVWDLDETLIVFNSLLSGAFARAAAVAVGHGKESSASVCDGEAAVRNVMEPELSHRAAELGHRLAEMVFTFCDCHMSFQKLDNIDPVSFLELWSLATSASKPAEEAEAEAAGGSCGCGRTVDRSSVECIASIYTDSVESLPGVMGSEQLKERASILVEAEKLTGGWVAAARQLLAGVTATAATSAAAATPPASRPGAPGRAVLAFRSVRHVLVSAGHLVATLGKLVLWGLDKYFDIRDIYSASGRPKLEIFRSLRSRFGPTAAYAAVGDGLEEERAAAVMGWGFVRVGFSAPAVQAHQGHGATAEPWRVPRPVHDIRPEDVLEAARWAY
ncbi:hypothetical protein VaNZ11_008866 [Volvox africanus]|uniref:protein-tyrosine-phosphatase n=1 Tax=Volvox africanus TaxID=51714 RepID=A0ABQ5S7B9_9CHLO|nr:hypothetical protein VaNZ11_008866 [Volvox africanus]